MVDAALRAAQRVEVKPLRRSRHATTYFVRLPIGSGAHGNAITQARTDAEPTFARDCKVDPQHRAAQLDLFIKLFNPPKGPSRLLKPGRWIRASKVARITERLRAHAFSTPSLLLLGEESRSRRSMLIARRAEGELLPIAVSRAAADRPARKWELLSALAREVARLHNAGFVHGDLTPYNVLVIEGPPRRFVLLDHDRTSLPVFLRRRRELRNLVQLGCREFDFLSKADRLRFFYAYAEARGLRAFDSALRRANAMLSARRRRDLRKVAAHGGG